MRIFTIDIMTFGHRLIKTQSLTKNICKPLFIVSLLGYFYNVIGRDTSSSQYIQLSVAADSKYSTLKRLNNIYIYISYFGHGHPVTTQKL